MKDNAAERFSSLRSQRKGVAGFGGQSRSRPLVFVAVAAGLYFLTAWLAGFWPFGAAAPSDPPSPPPARGARDGPPAEIRPDAPGEGESPRPTPQDPPPVAPPPTTRPAPPSPDAAEALVHEAEAEIAAARKTNDPETLRNAIASRVWDKRYPAAVRNGWLEESRTLAKRVVFSATPMAKALSVTVKDGDHYVGICAQLKKDRGLNVTPAFLERVNDVAPPKLRAKMVLKVPTEPLRIVVDKSEFRLWILLGDHHLLDYPVGLGRDERTPEGSFTVQWKTKNPDWTDPKTGRVLRYGDPGHLIGSRWLGFAGPDGSRTGFGIHGTIEPSSIGKNQSDGCVRMLTPDVEEIFELVPQGVLVIVRR